MAELGTVKFWKDRAPIEKPFGFIVPDDGGPDVYFDDRGLRFKEYEPKRYDHVKFDRTEIGPKKYAINVEPIGA